VLGLTLDLIKGMARRKKNGIESAAGQCSKCRVAVVLRQLEGTTRRFDALSQGSCPREHNRESEIGPTPTVIKSAALEQIAGHLSESITFFVVAEARARDHAQ
jgi:hypothetical protein